MHPSRSFVICPSTGRLNYCGRGSEGSLVLNSEADTKKTFILFVDVNKTITFDTEKQVSILYLLYIIDIHRFSIVKFKIGDETMKKKRFINGCKTRGSPTKSGAARVKIVFFTQKE